MDDNRLRFVAVLGFLLPLVGCATFINSKSAERRDQGYTLVFTGIESAHVGHAAFVRGLKSGGVPSEIELVDWTTGTPALMLVHLRAEKRNRRKAEEIAAKIAQYQDEYPGRPVQLIGHSGGGGMALLTLEALPQKRQIDSAILLAPAVSPDYDLASALTRVERGIWNYSSVGDGALLGVGTTVFGTMDGSHRPAAGALGFRVPPDAGPVERGLYAQKLFEKPYRPRMAMNGNLSDHFGSLNMLFARNEIAPILRGARFPNETRSLDELITTDPQFDRKLEDPVLPPFKFSSPD